MESTIIRDTLSDGTTIARIRLKRDSHLERYNQLWVGDIVLEYGEYDGRTWGRYFSITDYGNYAYAWYSIGDEPFEQFVRKMAESDQEYFMGKLTMGHDEGCVFSLSESKEIALQHLKESLDDGCIYGAEYKDSLDALADVTCEEELNAWYADRLDDSDGYESFVYGFSKRCRGYMENVFLLLAEVLKEG